MIITTSKLGRLPARDTTSSNSRARVAAGLQSREEGITSLLGRDAGANLGARVAAGGAGVVGGRAGPLACLNSCDGREGVDDVEWVDHRDEF
ncbi:hypothetical protein FPANT_1590 [Fusarium pseudoanthophilum]|uniref:Uncharacterized protein n=1 Tax=Fusarium pseudoanthophilum TaxID=48495 RepID=A0A8H5PSC8_9HYPO|nr:hypothetical protein FPANT_1590 [Fusarium pseudoanthophilum]